MSLKEDDPIEHLFVSSAHDYLLFFTSVGKVYRRKVWQLPLGGRDGKGRALQNLLPVEEGERVMAVFRTRDYSEGAYLVFGTRHGVVKKTALAAYNTPLKESGIAALIIRDDDALVDVRLADEGDRVMMISRNGYCVSFQEQDVRAMGRSASGVRGMRLRAGDEVIALRVPREGDSLLVVTEQGFGKRTPVDDYRVKGRGTMGVLTLERQAIARRGALVGALTVADGDELMTITASRHRHPPGDRRHPPDRPRDAGRDRPEAARRGRPDRGRRDRSAIPARATRRRGACRRRGAADEPPAAPADDEPV